MHKKFYASGFIFHLASGQILLQQDTSSENLLSQWLLFSGSYTEKSSPEKIFKEVISDLLDIELDIVHPVYSYENENISQCIVYSEIDVLKDFPPKKGLTFAWFSFRDILRLHLTEQTKHDIVVGQRVINAATRKRNGEHTFQ